MKTRIIHTKVWEDAWFSQLDENEKLFFLYLLTNPRINISGCYELTDRQILFDTGLSPEKLSTIKRKLHETGKVLFAENWVRVVNCDRYNSYRNSPKNELAYKKEVSLVPSSIKDILYPTGTDTSIDTSIHTSIHTPINNKSKIINNKSEILNKKSGDWEEKTESVLPPGYKLSD